MANSDEPRTPLSRDRILQAALALADDGGVESLTMRKLGQTLRFEAMSLYNHVSNKDDLIDGILDLVLEETELPAPGEAWDAAIRRSAVSVYEALRRHSWACAPLMSPDHVRPARLRFMDSLLGVLRDAGFSAETTYHAYHVLDGYILGFSFWHWSHTYTPAEMSDLIEQFSQMISPDVYAHLHEHAQQHMTDGPHREVSAFEFGLDLILDGLREIRDTA
jgi:AcrR family transcriptional regulator